MPTQDREQMKERPGVTDFLIGLLLQSQYLLVVGVTVCQVFQGSPRLFDLVIG